MAESKTRKRTRANGQGEFYQRPTGWYFRATIGMTADGTQKRKQFGPYRTKTAARVAHQEQQEQVKRGEVILDFSDVTVGEFLDGWCVAKGNSTSASTASFYRKCIGYVTPMLGSERLSRITEQHLNRLYSQLLIDGGEDKGLSRSTVGHIHRTLNTAMRDAIRRGIIVRNPCESADAPSRKAEQAVALSKMQVWTAEQAKKFLAHVADDDLYPLWRLALTTGRRRGELLGLRWRHLNLEAVPATVTIVESRTFVDGKEVNGAPKTIGSAGTITLDAVTAESLRNYRQKQEGLRSILETELGDDSRVFARADDSEWHPDHVAEIFRRKAKDAGLPVIRFHDLRHTYATVALTDGVPAKVVSQRLGHSDVGTTLRIYAHVLPQHDATAAEQVASLFA